MGKNQIPVKRDCPVCKGGGKVYDKLFKEVPCPECKGKGYIETKEGK